jgi:photosystem II stability/assembly factor-like uncharacterized protein
MSTRERPESPQRQFLPIWGGFSSGIVALTQDEIWVSEDGGRVRRTSNATAPTPTWDWVSTPVSVREQMESLYFLADGSRGWVVGDRGSVLGWSGSGNWTLLATVQDAIDPTQPAKLWDVHFLADGLTGWIAARHGLLKTTDGGSTWQWIIVDSKFDMYSFAFLAQPGPLFGVAFGEPGTILVTLDATGDQWGPLTVVDPTALCPTAPAGELEIWDGAFAPGSTAGNYQLLAVSGVGNVTGYILVVRSNAPSLVRQEYHQGSSVQCGGPPPVCPPNPHGYASAATVYGVAIFPDGTAVAAAYGGQVLRRAAGSKVWCDFTNPTQFSTGPLWKVAIPPGSNDVWIIGTFNALRRSRDTGLTWEELGSGKEIFRPRDVHFVTDTKGWVAAQGVKIAETNDGGVHWVRVVPGASGGRLNRLAFSAPTVGVAVGEENNQPDIRVYSGTWALASWPSGTLGALNDVAALGGGEFWTVGAAGLVLRSIDAGFNWDLAPVPIPSSVFPNPDRLNFTGVTYEQTTHSLFLVGNAEMSDPPAVLLRFDLLAATWSRIPVHQFTPPLNDITSGIGPSGATVFAVGDGGAIMRYRVNLDPMLEFAPDVSGPGMYLTGERLNAVQAVRPTQPQQRLQIFAVGDRGALRWFDGTNWSTPKSNTSLDLLGIHMRSPSLGWTCGRATEQQASDNIPRTGIVLRYS